MATVYGNALPTGAINLKQIRTAKDSRPYDSIDLISLCTTDINPYELASRKPNGSPPYSLLSFRGYRHMAIDAINHISVLPDGGLVNIQIGTSGIRLSNIDVLKDQTWFSTSLNTTTGVLALDFLSNPFAEARSAKITLSASGLSLDINIIQAGSNFQPPKK